MFKKKRIKAVDPLKKKRIFSNNKKLLISSYKHPNHIDLLIKVNQYLTRFNKGMVVFKIQALQKVVLKNKREIRGSCLSLSIIYIDSHYLHS